MSTQLGVNKIGQIKYPELFAGDFPKVTAPVTAASDLKAGSVLKKSDGAVSLCGKEDDVYGILAEDLKSGETGIAYLTGEFIGPRLFFAEGATWQNKFDNARSFSIFFHDASLA